MFRTSFALAFVSFFGILTNTSALQREIPSVANSVAEEIAASGKKSVAVVDFTDLQGNVTELGRFVAEELALGLVTAKKNLSVVDRTHLRAILQENKLGSSGLIDPATARKLGQITGVEALVTGSMTVLGDSIRLVVKVLDTNTARILAASSIDIAKTKTIEELMGRDIRGGSNSSTGGPPSVQRDVRSSPGNAPVFQSASIRATVGQIGVASDNSRVGLSVTIENISRNALYLAAVSRELYQRHHDADVTLSDDRATKWTLRELSGIRVLSLEWYSGRDPERTLSQGIFTQISPGERITLVMGFESERTTRRGMSEGMSSQGTPPATLERSFSFSVQCVSFTPSGTQRMSIGLPGIRATVLKQ